MRLLPAFSLGRVIALAALAASCGGSEAPAATGDDASVKAAQVYALMLDMGEAWEPLLAAQKSGDEAAVRAHAATLAAQARDAAFLTGREGEVWTRYVDLMQEGADALAQAEGRDAVKVAVQTLERSCNECHRRFQ